MYNILIVVWLSILRILFTFLHLLYSGLQYFDTAWSNFRRKLTENPTKSEHYVEEFVTTLEKCPKHLAIIVGNESIKDDDFANLVVWSLAAGVSFMTVYDLSGALLGKEEKLYSCITKRTKTVTRRIIFSNLKPKNGYIEDSTSTFIVTILDESHGKQAFSDFVLQLAKEKPSSLDHSAISSRLDSVYKYPDPEAAIVFGPVVSSYGYPPWKIRLTEFLHMPESEGITANEFCALLKKYSKCEQRLGK